VHVKSDKQKQSVQQHLRNKGKRKIFDRGRLARSPSYPDRVNQGLRYQPRLVHWTCYEHEIRVGGLWTWVVKLDKRDDGLRLNSRGAKKRFVLPTLIFENDVPVHEG
jgi:hypothetical protein